MSITSFFAGVSLIVLATVGVFLLAIMGVCTYIVVRLVWEMLKGMKH
jgi:uncharacterized membrane protein (Fun14 family)